MTTTVGTENTLESLLEDLIQLDYDAADAYQAAIDRLENSSYRTGLAEFKRDHLRHITELGDILSSMGRTPPKEGEKPSWPRARWSSPVMGDEAILQAMRTNEADTNTATSAPSILKGCRRTRGMSCSAVWRTNGATASGY